MQGGANDLCVEEFSAGESPATRRMLPRAGFLGHQSRKVRLPSSGSRTPSLEKIENKADSNVIYSKQMNLVCEKGNYGIKSGAFSTPGMAREFGATRSV